MNVDGTYAVNFTDTSKLTPADIVVNGSIAAAFHQIQADKTLVVVPNTGVTLSFTATTDAAGNILTGTLDAKDTTGQAPVTDIKVMTKPGDTQLEFDNADKSKVVTDLQTDPATGKTTPTVAVGTWTSTTTPTPPPVITGAAVGQIFGSSIGNALAGAIAGPNQFAQLAAGTGLSALLGTVGSTAGSLFDAVGNSATFAADVTTAFNSFGPNLGAAFVSQSIGSVSSFLAGELASSLGIGGTFGGKIGTIVASTLINSAITNVANGVSVFTGLSGDIFKLPSLSPSGALIPGGIGFNIGSNIGSFLGSALANSIIAPENLGGSLGSSIGSSIGSYITGGYQVVSAIASGTAIAASSLLEAGLAVILPGIGAFIGALLGTVLGNWLGNLFGGNTNPPNWAQRSYDTLDASGHLQANMQTYSYGYNATMANMELAALNGANAEINTLAAQFGGVITTIAAPVFGGFSDNNANSLFYAQTGDGVVANGSFNAGTLFNPSQATLNKAIDQMTLRAMISAQFAGGDAGLVAANDNEPQMRRAA